MHNYSTFISRNGCDSSGLRSFDQSWESPGYCDNISIVCLPLSGTDQSKGEEISTSTMYTCIDIYLELGGEDTEL